LPAAVSSRSSGGEAEHIMRNFAASDNRIGFVLAFALYLLFIKAGLHGMLTCRDVRLHGRGWEP
jgi:hypothetical protein